MIRKNFPSLELSNSLEDYIEAVRNIELEKGCVAVGEIAEALNVKKPSVSLAMKQLKERGLVEYTQYSPIVLTREGRYYADRVISCHTMVKEFLITVLKMEEKRADEVACGIEHIMTLEEISRFQLLTEHCRKSGE
ncbi:metal-dependent transcriptional regulator [Akkermansia sp.]|uniref:metal-dependent transcriptional regulator n=1 Tax=Akkermansia sp. TaxID=1872421 RepID=UPI003AEF9C8D